jgi:hypothetical protein
MTLDVRSAIIAGERHQWQRVFEAFCVCRHCGKSTVFVLIQRDYGHDPFLQGHSLAEIAGSINPYVEVEGFICLKDIGASPPPEFVYEPISKAFSEGAICVVTNCPNAAGAMFRLAIDLTTRPMLPADDVPGLNSKIRRDLGLRLPWLFQVGLLPKELEELSRCIREDGNDGAHAGTLTNEDALDLQDFTFALLERIFTEPERLRLVAQT